MRQRIAHWLTVLAVWCAAVLPAHAVEYNAVDAGKSKLAFVYTQMGVPVDGTFARFAVTLRFDPARPDAAKATFDLDLASIDAGSSEANDEVAGKAWFDTKAFPRAHFESTAFKALGGNRFEVRGKLTIKGRTRDVAAPFTFANGMAEGSFTLKRGDFAIGDGIWADYGTVANDIAIKFRLAAIGK